MGCGASKSADPGVAPAEKRPEKKEDKDHVKKSKLDGADDIGANFDAAAAVTVATGTAALYAGGRLLSPGLDYGAGTPLPSARSKLTAILPMVPFESDS